MNALTKTPIRERLRSGEFITLVNPRCPSTGLTEALAKAGSDMIFIDLEAGGWARMEDVESHVLAAHRGGAAALVRPASRELQHIEQCLAMDPDGLVFPMVEDARTAASLAAAVRASRRGSELIVMVLVESPQGVSNLESILDVDTIDAVFVGAGDLAASLGFPGQRDHPQVLATIHNVALAARRKHQVVGAGLTLANANDLLRSGISLAYLDAMSLVAAGLSQFRQHAAATRIS